MPLEEDHRSGRAFTPSLTERMRSLASRRSFASPDGVSSRDHSTDGAHEDDRDLDSGDGIKKHVSLSDIQATKNHPDSELQFREMALQALDSSQPLSKRISYTLTMSKDLAFYTKETTLAILDSAQDLGGPEANLGARTAAFGVLKTSASLPGLSLEERQQIFELAKHPVDGSLVDLQLKSLSILTKQGIYLEPFERAFKCFVMDLLQSQYSYLSDARRRMKINADRQRAPLPEERGLHSLLNLLTNMLNMRPETFDSESLVILIQGTIRIAEKTTSKTDMKKAVGILRTTIRTSRIPVLELKPTIEILCAISNAIPELDELTWDSIMLLLSSCDRDRTVEILLETLALAPQDRHSHTVCGALGVICYLVTNNDAHDLPTVTFSQFIESLWEVHFASRRIRRDCLKAVLKLLLDKKLTDQIFDNDWDHMIQIILTATGDETYIHDRASEPLTIRSHVLSKTSVVPDTESTGDRVLADEILNGLKSLAEAFNSLWMRMTPEQRQLVGLFYYKLRLVLPSQCLKQLVRQLAEADYYNPGNERWQSHQLEMLRLFIWDRDMEDSTISLMIRVLADALGHDGSTDREHFHTVILRLLNDLKDQLTPQTAYEVAHLAAKLWKTWHPVHLEENLERFWPLLRIVKSSPTDTGLHFNDNLNISIVSVPFVGLFLTYFERHAGQAKIIFNFLIEIAKAIDLSPSVRLPALRLLTSLRCDQLGRIIITITPDSLGLASNLCRTEFATPDAIQPMQVDRLSLQEDQMQSRSNRTSVLSQTFQSTARVNPRTPNSQDRISKQAPIPPLWMYPGGPGLPQNTPAEPSRVLLIHQINSVDSDTLKLSEWLLVIIEILQQGGHWEVYSYILVHLPSQISNPSLFSYAIPHVKMLRNVIASQLQTGKFQEPPLETGVKKGDVALCLFNTLTMLISYTENFARAEQDDMVRTFLAGVGGWDRTAKICIHALAISCHQIPWSITKALNGILLKMAQIITQSNLAMDILEFLGGLARLPNIYVNFREEEFRHVFAICVRYLEHAREQRLKVIGAAGSGVDYNSNRLSGASAKSTGIQEPGHNLDVQKELPQYLFALAHHVLTIWFLSVRLTDRSSHVGWITRNLAWIDQEQNEIMEEQSQVTLDMMHRTAYLDLGETIPLTKFTLADGKLLKKTWLLGLSIVTIETAIGTGLTQITKRQASGTTYATYQQQAASLPPHHVPLPTDVLSSLHGPEARINIFPNHVFLQLTSTIAPTPTPMEPICLPDDDITKRAISSFDRNDTVDGYKVGVIYIGNGQFEESKILANTEGSQTFQQLLQGLGTKVQLKGATFNTQGLDTESDIDGTHTYAWRDRIAEVVFHVPTMMPTDMENDPQSINKKRHIGNNFVNIIFNESGLPFQFGTFHSQFNYVNIVIAPDNKPIPLNDDSLTLKEGREGGFFDKERIDYYTIQTVSSPLLPSISPAASRRILPLTNIPALARQLALNCSVFSNVWATREGGEHISSWRNRLREIVKLRARFANMGTNTSTKYSGAKSIKTYVSGDSFKGRVEMGGLAEEEGILAGLDFSRWAGPNPPLS